MAEWNLNNDRPQARVLLDSVAPVSARLTTMEVTIHRFVLAELNTHRVFSRNSASSRAIPFAKQVKRVRDSPAVPVEWRAEQSGMQGGDLLAEDAAAGAEEEWLYARDKAVGSANELHALGVHKGIVNRLLEPFLWHNVIITSTEWSGFWAQRCSPHAQPEIRVAAEAMRAAYDASEPQQLYAGEWHTPLIQPDEDMDFWKERVIAETGVGPISMNDYYVIREAAIRMRNKVSAARCARVSYMTHDGKRDVSKDLQLYDRLASADPGHWSPLEHVARARGKDRLDAGRPQRGNLSGWHQLRHDVEPVSP
jgi:thymidylate synthase ThyX